MFDVLIIGGGVIGAMIAREISFYKLNTIVIEKENDVGNVTSMANSAIVHSGYDPEPNTLKAKLNVLGNSMFDEIASDLDVTFKRIGSLTVALEEHQLQILQDLEKRSKINGVDVKLLDAKQTKLLEPCLSDDVKGSLFAPTAGIINPFTLTVHALENAINNGVKLSLGEEVINIIQNDNYFDVITNKFTYQTKIIINCAGLFGDKIHSLIEPIDYSINPRKGEYFVLLADGESMTDAGIDDGDYVIVRKTNTADYGKIIVALDNDNRNTLKRLEFDNEKKRPYLHPENKKYKDIYPAKLSIQGVAEKVIKNLI